MIKKTVVCDRCGTGKPWVIITKSEKLESNTVFCKECARYYYDIDCSAKCENCGVTIAEKPLCRIGAELFCSPLCAMQYCERHYGDHEEPRYFTEEDEKMLLGKDEGERKEHSNE